MSDAAKRERLARRVRRVADVMDDAVEIPVLGIRVGLDALLGLVPGVGDALGASVSLGYLVAAARAGAPRLVLARMLGNIAVDVAVGFVPLAGDLFDIAFRANRRNADLFVAWAEAPGTVERRTRRGVAAIAVVLGSALLGAVVVGAWLLVALVRWLSG